MSYILALDQGTSSSRSIVFDRKGQIVALAQRELPQIYPRPGWVEHSPLEIWNSQLATAQEALKKAGLSASDISALGITNQRETTVLWNRKTGVPVHNAIVWQDRRAEPLCAALREQGMAETIQAKTGLLIDAYFSGSKLQWLLDNVPGAREQAERGELAFGTVDSWLIWQLTQGQRHVTDVSNASRTMLFNVHTNEWDDELLDHYQLAQGSHLTNLGVLCLGRQHQRAQLIASPVMAGARFAGADQSGWQSFSSRYRGRYGSDPVRTASLAYDAVSLVAALVQTQGGQRFAQTTLTNPSGFRGVDGVFRFQTDGTIDRGLAVLEINGGAARIVSPSPQSFSSAGL